MGVVDAKPAHGCIGGVFVKVRSGNLRDLAPRSEFFGSDVAPVCAAVARDPDQTVVGARPQGRNSFKGRRQRVNDSALFFRVFANKSSDTGGSARVFSRQILADRFPGISAVGGFEKHIRREVKDVGINRREHQRLGAVGSIFRAAQRNRCDVLHLASRPVVLCNLAAAAPINKIGIERIRRDVAILDHTHGMPVAVRDPAIISPAGDANGTAFLLPGADAIGKSVVRRNVIELRCRLVVPGTPGCAAVHRDDGALIADQQNDVAVVGIDPQILIIVAAGRSAKAGPGFAAIGRAHGHGAGNVDEVGIFRIYFGNRKISTTDAAGGTCVRRDLGPGFAGVVGAINAEFVRSCGNGCVKAVRIAGRDRDINLSKIFRQAIGQPTPRAAIIGGLEQSAVRAVEVVVILPRPFASFPHRSVNDVGIRGIDIDIRAAGVLILGDHFLPRLPAVNGAIDSALGTRSVRMPEHGSENPIWIARIDR